MYEKKYLKKGSSVTESTPNAKPSSALEVRWRW
jgi:hypothetical protein